QHWGGQRENKCGKQITLLAIAQSDYGRIRGRPLDPVTPAEVGIISVVVVLAVGLIALIVVADQILQSETVMNGNEVDACPGTPAAPAEDVGRAGDARS